MSAGDFTQGQQRRSRVWEEGFKRVWELWVDGALSGTLNRLRITEPVNTQSLTSASLLQGWQQRGNAAPAQTRGVFPLILVGISPITANQQPKHAQTLRGHPAPGRDSSFTGFYPGELTQLRKTGAVSCAEPGLGFDHAWGSLPAL